MQLWRRDYFELKAMEKQQTQEKLSSPICLNVRHKFPFMKMSPPPFNCTEIGEQFLITRDTLTTLRLHEAPGDPAGADSVERWNGFLIDVDPGEKEGEEGDVDYSFERFS